MICVSGCATVVSGKYQNIPVTSDPPGVKVRSSSGPYIITPGSFQLRRNEDHTLVAEYPGFEPQQKVLKHKLQGWFWGNILLGGIIGGIVDLSSGASDDLVPDKVHFDFTTTGLVIESRKRSYLESHLDTTDEVRFAILNELAIKGMTKDELIASFGKPTEITEEGKYEVFIYESRTPKRYYFKDGVLEKTELGKASELSKVSERPALKEFQTETKGKEIEGYQATRDPKTGKIVTYPVSEDEQKK